MKVYVTGVAPFHTKVIERGVFSQDEELLNHYLSIHRLGDDDDFMTVRDMEKGWSNVKAACVYSILL